MSDLSINAEARFLLDGVSFKAPIDWQDVTIVATYENDSIQPSLNIENFVFPLKAREAINLWISNGMSGGVGIYEGMPFQLTLFNNQSVQENFKSFIDFTNGYKDLPEDGKVSVSIIKDESLDNFFEQIEGTTYGYLESIGAIPSSSFVQIPYVVEKKFNLLELLISAIILYLMIKELAEAIEKLVTAIADVIAHVAGGISGSIAGALYAIAKAIIILAYIGILVVAIIELGNKLLEALVPKVRNHLGIKLTEALRLVCLHFGYGFSAPIAELENVVYLPSNPNLDEKTAAGFISVIKGTQSGVPFTGDYGYKCDEMFQLAKDLFDAKIAIINGVVVLRPKNDPFWFQQSTYVLPSVLIKGKEYKKYELKADRLLTFVTDLNDEWTIDNYGGTSFEIRTEPILVIRKRAVLIKGLDEINFQVALGNRKNSLNAIEEFLKVVAKSIDGLTGFFGSGTNLADSIEDRVGVLKQSNNWHAVPKLLYLNDGALPSNHRTKWNSEILYDKYWVNESFVLNNFFGQKTVYKNVRVGFGFEDYKKLLANPYFNFKGKVAKIINFEWTYGQDFAEIDFWVREPHSANLKEIYMNPS